MPLLTFISDENLHQATRTLLDAAASGQARVAENPYRNVIDPFSALIGAAKQSISTDEWMQQEIARQIEKSFSGALGDFHQDILGFMPGWENAGRGGSYDIKNTELGVIAEVKNKHNTMNARSALSVYDNLQRHLDYGSDNVQKAFLVEVLPETPRPYERPFTPSERGTPRPARNDLVKIDGKSFYAMASGEEEALRKLYEALPSVLAGLLNIDETELRNTKVFTELFDRAYLLS